MNEVVLAPGVARAPLAALTFFGAGGVAIGALQAIGAARIAAATDAAAGDLRIGGVAIAVIGALVLWVAVRQWRAIDRIRVEDDGAWSLVARSGRTVRVPADRELRLELSCRRVAFTWGGPVRIRDVVGGWVTAGAVRRRLAWSGPHTWDQALAALGLAGKAPRRGEVARYERRRAAV